MADEKTTDTIYFASSEQYKKWFGGRSILSVVLVVVFVIILSAGKAFFLLPLAIIIGIPLYFFIRSTLRKNLIRITVTKDAIIHRGFFRTSTIALKEGIEGFYGTYVTANPWPLKTLFLASKTSHKRLQLNAGFWKEEDLLAIANAADVTILGNDVVRTTKQVAKENPRLLPYYAAHPWKWGIGLFFALLLIIVLLIVIANLTKS